jgi:mRNA interferase RelE/StbE
VIRRVVFRPAAVRDLARLDRVVQARIDAALVRFAATGHGDVKALKDRPGELRPRVGKWRVFFCLEPPDFIRVLGIDNRGEAY